MAFLIAANDAQTTLSGPISSGALTINVAGGTGALFPQPQVGQYFVATLTDAATGLVNEIVQVTAVNVDAFTVVRGQEGTTARAWAANDVIGNWWTAGSMTALIQIAQLQVQATNYAVDTGPSANTYVISLTPAPVSLASITGTPIRFRAIHANNGVSTLAVNGLAPATITNSDGSNLGAQILTGHITEVVYNGTNFELMSSSTSRGFGVATGSIASNTTLTSANWGAFYNLGNAVTITLPTPSSVTGMTVGFVSVGSAVITASTGTFYGGGVTGSTSVALNASDWFCVQSDGSSWRVFSASSGVTSVHGMAAFSSSATWTVPVGVHGAWVRAWAAGGGSGGCWGANSASQAGSGGEYAEGYITGLVGGTGVSVSVGVGGTAGQMNGGAPTSGGVGGNTVVGTFITVIGGNGGSGALNGVATNVVQGGSGGTGGAVHIPGASGTAGFVVPSGVVTAAGGSSFGSGMAHLGPNSVSANGIPGIFPGGGAAGGCNQAPGAVGAAGLVIFNW